MSNAVEAIFKYVVRHVCEIVLLICLYFSFQQQIKNNNLKEIIRSDGIGYYSYLPAVFIYHDYEFSFIKDIEKKHDKRNFEAPFLTSTASGTANKYFVGLSLLWLPFFLIAHFLSLLLGFDADGYSLLYQVSVLIAANFYLWLGCRYTWKLILRYSLPQSVAAFIILLIVFGTNLSFYTTFDPELSHVYSFAAIAAFLFFTSSFLKFGKVKHIYLAAFLFGIVILLRPSNLVVILMIPFFTESYKSFLKSIRKFRKAILVSLLLFVATLFFQSILYYLQTGHFILWSYGNEKFFFTDPQMINVLFSYRKGLFVYTPLTLISLAGLFYLYKMNKFRFMVMVLFLLSGTYIISCWWCWWYGASFGQRAFVDYYSILGLLIAFTYSVSKSRGYRLIFFIVTCLFIPYSLILSYQYRNYIIDWGEMNKQKFWFAFLKTNPKYDGVAFSKNLFSGNDPIHIVAIKASNNKYVCAETDGSDYLLANRNETKSWESFNIIHLDKNRIALKSDKGKYISARLDNANALMPVADKIDTWEKFDLIKLTGSRFRLRACNNKFVTRAEEKLFANSDSLNDAEIFLLEEK